MLAHFVHLIVSVSFLLFRPTSVPFCVFTSHSYFVCVQCKWDVNFGVYMCTDVPAKIANCILDFADILSEVAKLTEKVEETESDGRFEWVDSVLVTAVRYGHWVCLTNCNFCK